jgi:hypothetical protein
MTNKLIRFVACKDKLFCKDMKNFFIKKSLNKSLRNINNISDITIIKSVGLIIDESNFLNKDSLIKEIIFHGIDKSNIEVIIFREKFNTEEVFHYPTFSNKHLSWNGNFTEKVVNDFIMEPFDLLISFYESEKAPLLVLTNKSKAGFKVGFASVDKRLNHLLIETQSSNYKIFVHEMFRYLKILKRI